jgi:hypothetical protein
MALNLTGAMSHVQRTNALAARAADPAALLPVVRHRRPSWQYKLKWPYGPMYTAPYEIGPRETGA